MSPFIVAAVSALATLVLYFLAGKIDNKYFRGGAQIGAVVLGIVLAGSISADNVVAATAGQYFFYILVIFVVVAKLFGKKKNL